MGGRHGPARVDRRAVCRDAGWWLQPVEQSAARARGSDRRRHTVVVTDCYRTRVPQPQAEANGARFTPCRDAEVVIRAEQLTVNGTPYGPLSPGARVLVDHGRVSIGK